MTARGRPRPKTAPVAAALLVALALLALAACSGSGPDSQPKRTGKPAEPARAVRIARVQLEPIAGGFGASGLLVPREEAAVGSELAGYRVAQVLVEEGDRVARGQPLARLDDTLLRARIAQARANVAQAVANAARARGEADRVRGLDETGVLSVELVQQRRFEAESAQAAVEVARAQLAGLGTEASRLTVRAPVAGLVLERTVRPGDVAAAGAQPMFRIARDRLIELAAEVPEHELARIEPGARAVVTLPSGVELAGSVRRVAPRVDPQTKLAEVRVGLPVSESLRAGGYARVAFEREARPVPAVPEKAVHFESSGPLVVVIGADDRARRVAIRPGARARGWVELTQGPPVGTRVALGGGVFLLDGDLVEPVADAAGSAVARTTAP